MRSPFRTGRELSPDEWDFVRRRTIFSCCKWDVQSQDHSVLAPFPVLLDAGEWQKLASYSEALSHEAIQAEHELLRKPTLLDELSLPKPIARLLKRADDDSISAGVPRIMRFDFHFTPAGWLISEVNSDVPGGFIEASGFTRIMAEFYPEASVPPDPSAAYVAAAAKVIGSHPVVGLIHATAHSDDYQVMHYLAGRLHEEGIEATLLSPAHLRWDSGVPRISCRFAEGEPALLMRFFPAEWLPNLRPASSWESYFLGGKVPVSNPGFALLLQTKRFPLIWNSLKSHLKTWGALMPETVCPRSIQSSAHSDWVYKPNLGRVGQDVAIFGVTETNEYNRILDQVRRKPTNWAAQKRFETLALATESGPRYLCIGVFTVDGIAVGAYGRIAAKPLIDHEAQDIAILISKCQNQQL